MNQWLFSAFLMQQTSFLHCCMSVQVGATSQLKVPRQPSPPCNHFCCQANDRLRRTLSNVSAHWPAVQLPKKGTLCGWNHTSVVLGQFLCSVRAKSRSAYSHQLQIPQRRCKFLPELSEIVEVPFSGVNFYRVYVSQQICYLCGGTPVPLLLQQSVRANRYASSTSIAPLFDDLRIGPSPRFRESKGSRWARSFAGSAAVRRAFCIWLDDCFPEVWIVSIVHADHDPRVWDETSPLDGDLFSRCDSFAHRLHDRLVCCTVDAVHAGECVHGGQGTHGHRVFEAGTADELDPPSALQRCHGFGSKQSHVRVFVSCFAWMAWFRPHRISSIRGRATWTHPRRPASSSVRHPSRPLRRPMRSTPSDGPHASVRHGPYLVACRRVPRARRRLGEVDDDDDVRIRTRKEGDTTVPKPRNRTDPSIDRKRNSLLCRAASRETVRRKMDDSEKRDGARETGWARTDRQALRRPRVCHPRVEGGRPWT